MPPNFQHPVTITIVQKIVSGQDEFNNDVYEETTFDVVGSIQPSTSRENLNFADQSTSGVVAFVPYGTDVQYIDAFIVGGVRYEVNGQPDIWTSPFSGTSAPVRMDGTLVVGASS